MMAHNAPTMQQQPFFFLAKSDTIKNNIPVMLSCKYINPFYYGKCYKMYSRLIPDFVAAFAHDIFPKIIDLTAFGKADTSLQTKHNQQFFLFIEHYGQRGDAI
jgi:hypothetical protein